MEKEDNSRPIIESDLAKKLLMIDGKSLKLDDSLTSAGPDPDKEDVYLLKYQEHNTYNSAFDFAAEEAENVFDIATSLGYDTNCICAGVSESQGPYVPEVSIQ